MRFYDIQITDQQGNSIQIGGVALSFSSFKNGVTTPGALNIELDIPVVSADVPAGNAYVKIWGVDLNTINNAAKLHNANITIMAGMMPGLPLANLQANALPRRNGIIFQGSIWQAFGNWQGNEQTLDLVITTELVSKPTDTPKLNRPLIFNCQKGASFSDALTQSMKDAGITSKITVDPKLTPAQQILFKADNMGAFSRQLIEQSIGVLKNPSYEGIKTIKTSAGYDFNDNSTIGTPIKIDFLDLIGQPTWIDFVTLQMKCVMRSDIKVGDTIQIPKANILTSARSFGNLKEDISFSGTAWVKSVRHIGSFRQPDANSWVTVINVTKN